MAIVVRKKETKTVEQLRAEVAGKDREYEASNKAALLLATFEQCEVELKQCKRLIDRRKANPLGGYSNQDFLKMFVSRVAAYVYVCLGKFYLNVATAGRQQHSAGCAGIFPLSPHLQCMRLPAAIWVAREC